MTAGMGIGASDANLTLNKKGSYLRLLHLFTGLLPDKT